MKNKNPCAHCSTEAECAANDWCLYDPYNKKCPNWLDGVKQYHRFCKELRRDEKLNFIIPYYDDIN